MPAIDTVAFVATIAAGPVFTAVTPASGDSVTLRNFSQADGAFMFAAAFSGAAKGQLRIRSPRLHDSNTGIILASGELPSTLLWPRGIGQPLYPSDVLTVELNGTAAAVDGGFFSVYYNNLSGANARLHTWHDVQPLIVNVKPFVTAVTNSGTAGTWTDTVVTTTDNQLAADADYAVLGYTVDTAMLAVGVKGQETGNLRVAGPGSLIGLDTAEYFLAMDDRYASPFVPVVNANNRGSLYVSTLDRTASTAGNVTLWMAELGQKVTP
jgi:hypothetical protein